MNKTALKSFATEARRELLEKVQLQARKIGITPDAIKQASVESSDAIFIDGRQLSDTERKQRNKLIARIKEIGYDRVMEEAAYTWFNRFIALRYMEVNDYLPTKIRVLSSVHPDSIEPDMFKEALNLDLPIDKELVYNLKIENKTDELFKYLIKVHCNDLNRYMPFMFETLEDYKEILFPDGLLGKDALISKLTDTTTLAEETWQTIEVIGWLYQYYIAEEKDRVFKAKSKYKPEEIPFATQLFTPDWIVQYMVQNSLGRYWTEAHPEHEDLIAKWDYFIKHEEVDFQEKIAPYVNKQLNVEDIKCFDPAMGSGHILVYMFDVLYEIYSKCGYMDREIPSIILEKNLYGLDIDDRAYQLASFSLVMKALQYNKRFLRSIERDGLTLNLASIQETNSCTEDHVAYLAGEEQGATYDTVQAFIKQYTNAKTFGSLIKITQTDTAYLENKLHEIQNKPADNIFHTEIREQALSLLPQLIQQTKIMRNTYDIVVMNPPYMGSGSMSKELADFLKTNYPDSKSDLFAAFMEVDQYIKENGFYAAINQHSWMFLSSFEKLREKIINNKFIDTMLHLGPRAFEEIGGEVVQSTAFVLRNAEISNIKGTYLRLIDERTAIEKKQRVIEAVQNPSVSYRYSFKQQSFSKISGSPIAYWVSEELITSFRKGNEISLYGAARRGLQTGDSQRFIKNWFEINSLNLFLDDLPYHKEISEKYKWFPFNSGGSFRKWYGNIIDVVDWGNNGENIKSTGKAIIPSEHKYFKPCISWNKVSSGKFSVRYQRQGIIQGDASPFFYTEDESYLIYIIALLNSSVVIEIMKILSPTLNFEVGNISKVPVLFKIEMQNEIEKFVKKCIEISRDEWNSFETSWDFISHPLLKQSSPTLVVAFKQWSEFSESQFNQLKSNEEELNRIFIDIYSLQDDLTPEVDEKDVTVRKADLERDVRSFISYAVGCGFGRYSLDEEGLVYAGGEFDLARYKTFPADADNVLPILSGAYFEDDIVTRFVEFVRVTFSEETLEENLDFVADAVGRKKNETARETIRRYFLNDFFKHHEKTYKGCPIYWLFTSGKEKAFNCLIYMHRYDKTTLSRIRTDYLHEVQIRMDAEKNDLLNIINGDSTVKEIAAAKKELKSLEKKIDELKRYDELLHHMADQQIDIDLDDGVVHNYGLFAGLVAKI